MIGHLAVILIAEIHIGVAGIIGQLLSAILHALVLPVDVLELRRPRRNLVGEFGIQIFFKLIPVLVSGRPSRPCRCG